MLSAYNFLFFAEKVTKTTTRRVDRKVRFAKVNRLDALFLSSLFYSEEMSTAVALSGWVVQSSFNMSGS